MTYVTWLLPRPRLSCTMLGADAIADVATAQHLPSRDIQPRASTGISRDGRALELAPTSWHRALQTRLVSDTCPSPSPRPAPALADRGVERGPWPTWFAERGMHCRPIRCLALRCRQSIIQSSAFPRRRPRAWQFFGGVVAEVWPWPLASSRFPEVVSRGQPPACHLPSFIAVAREHSQERIIDRSVATGGRPEWIPGAQTGALGMHARLWRVRTAAAL